MRTVCFSFLWQTHFRDPVIFLEHVLAIVFLPAIRYLLRPSLFLSYRTYIFYLTENCKRRSNSFKRRSKRKKFPLYQWYQRDNSRHWGGFNLFLQDYFSFRSAIFIRACHSQSRGLKTQTYWANFEMHLFILSCMRYYFRNFPAHSIISCRRWLM